jgi:hypothetical protein
MISLKVPDEELAAWKAVAKLSGCGLSEWLRGLANDAVQEFGTPMETSTGDSDVATLAEAADQGMMPEGEIVPSVPQLAAEEAESSPAPKKRSAAWLPNGKPAPYSCVSGCGRIGVAKDACLVHGDDKGATGVK